LNLLQRYIRQLSGGRARALGNRSPDRLMGDTLTANFGPFRSPSWDRLAKPAQSIEFSRALWRMLLELLDGGTVDVQMGSPGNARTVARGLA
jgi:hypothetical protein